jgi:hypothetical protein
MEQGFRSARHIAADRRMPDASVTGDRESSNGLRILGPGSPPHLGFACCEYGVEQMQSLFAQPDLIETLKDLHATVAIPTQDFSPRAGVVRLLDREGAPLLPGLFCPESRCSQEFYDNCNRALAEVGLMVVNICVKNHRRILSRIRKSFGGQIVRGRKFIPNEA